MVWQGDADKDRPTSSAALVPATATEGPDILASATSISAAPPEASTSDGHFRIEEGDGAFTSAKNAEQTCGSKGLASVTPENMPAVKQLIAASSLSSPDTPSMVIGKWNNDDYGMEGTTCLLISRNDGTIYSGPCSSANHALCQS